ncbi:YeeE/YedE family protein [soil metagenome]
MKIDWANLTALPSLSGGMLIGTAVAILLLMNGRVAGISGILGGLLRPTRGDLGWRIAMLSGLILAPLLYRMFAPLPSIRIDTDTVVLIAAGLLVGAGTGYGSGCTSGHGVCGLSRLSPRSLVATLAFMFAGFATVVVVRHWLA